MSRPSSSSSPSSSSPSSSSTKEVAPEAASSPPTTMGDLDAYFSRLMLKELDHFRAGPPSPADNITTTAVTPTTTAPTATAAAFLAAATAATSARDAPATEVAETITASPAPAKKQQEEEEYGNASKKVDESATAPAPAVAAAVPAPPQELRLLTIPNATPREKRNNGARLQRVYRLAAKLGVSPGAAAWVRGGRAYAQPAVPESAVVKNNSVEYNQFMYDDSDGDKKVVLRMPGGWKRDLVRSRPAFRGVAVIDGFLWPRFSPNLPRGVTVDWEEQGFVEFNEVRYTTPFVAREARPARAGAGGGEDDGVLIRFDE